MSAQLLSSSTGVVERIAKTFQNKFCEIQASRFCSSKRSRELSSETFELLACQDVRCQDLRTNRFEASSAFVKQGEAGTESGAEDHKSWPHCGTCHRCHRVPVYIACIQNDVQMIVLYDRAEATCRYGQLCAQRIQTNRLGWVDQLGTAVMSSSAGHTSTTLEGIEAC